ncbi:subunit of tubulin prefoldin [Exophiala dermatitidis]|uniref:Prefoldin, alpha subunit n=1 Tax=Exophiala dermatitidis (strain ATCC 34100 / CBS 525.76 / NIH/UT8656) TaxID=858893 RepID=H6C6H0_EXODN|nr:prefoldin, alpha subunit [Exophiala dermatitidis NIH/UT8656]KAJ4522907.1 subunit of tubulin prefoldin [Exophiala dermatitidis]EHY59316.1 prefoldin, alpha subunit [Exophiala dermatitidis NIH/UT8656]KAJ4526221.1 subunit of tubulin prefoldin [Exophiala dermatitidis]KAJ4526836.1 subunit of tubulin prefoldin [Exophiala dermatitidis]KAJ4532544.1 subunit of tubulin prefoldin [Exophiala dermatitidis]
MSSQPPQNAVDITTLSVQQLSALQARLSQELEHLTTSYQRLRAAQARFKDCIRSIQQGVQGKSGETPLLIPLTTSLYVPGTLAAPTSTDSSSSSSSTVLVDIGTGFFVEKTPEDGIKFYTGKVDDLGKNLLEIEKAVGGKNESLRVVEDVLRQKMLAEQAAGSAPTNQPSAQATVG